MYESKSDLENEKKFVVFMNEKFKVDLKKLPISYGVDFLALKHGMPYRLVEFKRRHCESTTYDTIMLSALKYANAMMISNQIFVPFVFAVQFNDGIFVTDYQKPMVTGLGNIEWGGRTKATRDSADIEPVIHIPTERFQKLGEII